MITFAFSHLRHHCSPGRFKSENKYENVSQLRAKDRVGGSHTAELDCLSVASSLIALTLHKAVMSLLLWCSHWPAATACPPFKALICSWTYKHSRTRSHSWATSLSAETTLQSEYITKQVGRKPPFVSSDGYDEWPLQRVNVKQTCCTRKCAVLKWKHQFSFVWTHFPHLQIL